MAMNGMRQKKRFLVASFAREGLRPVVYGKRNQIMFYTDSVVYTCTFVYVIYLYFSIDFVILGCDVV